MQDLNIHILNQAQKEGNHLAGWVPNSLCLLRSIEILQSVNSNGYQATQRCEKVDGEFLLSSQFLYS